MPPRRRASTAAALAAIASIALTACGGSSSSGGSSDAHDRYVASADKICQRADAIGQALSQQLSTQLQQQNMQGAVQVIQNLQPAYRQELDRLAALKPPAAEAAKAKAVVDELNARADAVSVMARAIEGNDTALIQKLAAEQDATKAKARALAKDFGFKVCGAPDSQQ